MFYPTSNKQLDRYQTKTTRNNNKNMQMKIALAILGSLMVANAAATNIVQSGSASKSGSVDGYTGTASGNGAVNGKVITTTNSAEVKGAVSGTGTVVVNGFGNVTASGAANGVAGVDTNGKAYASGAADGRVVTGDGKYGAEGAVAGSANANYITGQYGFAGSLNGCYWTPAQVRVCFNQNGPKGPGFYDEKNNNYGPSVQPTWKPDTSKSGTQGSKSVGGASSNDASHVVGGFSVIAASVLAALF